MKKLLAKTEYLQVINEMKPDLNERPALLTTYIIFMVVIVVVGSMDLVLDQFYGENLFHTIVEIFYIAFAVISGSYIWLSYKKSSIQLDLSNERINELIGERDEWKKKHESSIVSLHSAILSQLNKWQLSPSEQQVALYLMRGYSHKQIGGLLDKSERTVRNQSLNIYKKTGMTGRSELTAFFLEDLLGTESHSSSDEE